MHTDQTEITPKSSDQPKETSIVLTETVRGCTVKIYLNVKPRGTYYRVVDYSSGMRKFVYKEDEPSARKEAKRIAALMADGDARAAQMSGEDRQRYATILKIISPLNTDPVAAVAEYFAAKQRLGAASLIKAVDFYMAKHAHTVVDKSVSEVVEVLLSTKESDHCSEAYLRDLKTRLTTFSRAFVGDIASVQPAQINAFLRNLKCSGRSRNNYRRAIATLFRFAETEGFVARDHLCSRDIARAKEEKAAVEVFTKDEICALLHAAMNPEVAKAGVNRRYLDDQGLLPLLVLGAFAGLRTAEIERQLWSDISVETGEILVTAEKGNTAQNRIVPISPCLKEWLKICRRTSETCCSYGRTNEAVVRLVRRAGVSWKHNGLRHSYISYRVAVTKDVPMVALEAGNSPAMIFRHYRKPLPTSKGDDWFSITPEIVQKWAASKTDPAGNVR